MNIYNFPKTTIVVCLSIEVAFDQIRYRRQLIGYQPGEIENLKLNLNIKYKDFLSIKRECNELINESIFETILDKKLT